MTGWNSRIILAPLAIALVAFAPVEARGTEPMDEVVQASGSTEEQKDVGGWTVDSRVSLNGLLETEAAAGSHRGEDASDVTLATMELGVEASLGKRVGGNLVLLWEEDDTEPVDIDVATIALSGSVIPVGFEIGKLYVPFGVFDSYFVSDPIALELGETRESALVLGYDHERLEVRVGAFNGNLNASGDDDHVDDLVSSVVLTPTECLRISGYWISDIGESDVLEEFLVEALSDSGSGKRTDVSGSLEPVPGKSYQEVAGAGGAFSFGKYDLEMIAEYVTALDDFNADLLGGENTKPQAWNIELARYLTKNVESAIKYEGSDGFPDMPTEQYGLCLGYSLTENCGLFIEYLHGEYENGDERDVATAQVAIEF
jgi:hypothetical protein